MNKRIFNIDEENKKKLEDKIMDLVLKFKDQEDIDCITLSTYTDYDTLYNIVLVTLIFENKKNSDLLEEEVSSFNKSDESAGEYKVRLSATYKNDILDSRRRFFKNDRIIIDKKYYRMLQQNIREYQPFANTFEFEPPLVLAKRDNK